MSIPQITRDLRADPARRATNRVPGFATIEAKLELLAARIQTMVAEHEGVLDEREQLVVAFRHLTRKVLDHKYAITEGTGNADALRWQMWNEADAALKKFVL